MTQRMLFFEKQHDLEKAREESASTDRRAMVSVFEKMANAMTVLAR